MYNLYYIDYLYIYIYIYIYTAASVSQQASFIIVIKLDSLIIHRPCN